MTSQTNAHTFHIPVMGTGFSIDTPVKVAPYGISSVISIVDDILVEQMREYLSSKYGHPYTPITDKQDDFRALRITSYLNLVEKIVSEKFEKLKQSVSVIGGEWDKFVNMLPDTSGLKNSIKKLIDTGIGLEDLRNWLNDHITPGSIDVNIMTKLDKENYGKDGKLPIEFNDAHAALRGFARSTLSSSLVLSAGINPRLYSYIEQFDDFYPDADGFMKKKIILKVSDYRSAMVQGRFLAKKGVWVSEYRIESGLNCGGHAFATDGFLLGPILAEFKNNKSNLAEDTYKTWSTALASKNRPYPKTRPELKITVQGGVGTAQEQQMLLDYFGVDSVGWGTPFLLVPEATNVDEKTLRLLVSATEKDLYLSHISPLGVPFNSIRGNSKDMHKQQLIEKGRPGSSCPKQFLQFNKEFTEQPICLASRQYQKLKKRELDDQNLDPVTYQRELEKITEKACLCIGLGNSVLQKNEMDATSKTRNTGVSICPGPNMAYFSKIVTLKEMVDHIYGRINIITRTDRPNLFLKELYQYLDYFKKAVDDIRDTTSKKQQEYLNAFRDNLCEGIRYYRSLVSDVSRMFHDMKMDMLDELEAVESELRGIEIDSLFAVTD
jgi:hypothetical protein